MKLIELINDYNTANVDIEIQHLTLNSRKSTKTTLFFALQGENHHGLDFLAGLKAAVVLAEPSQALPVEKINKIAKNYPFPILIIENLGQFVSKIAAKFYHQPSQKMQMIGITGTNGKTSIAHFITKASGNQAAMIGTLGVGRLNHLIETGMTTPDPIHLQQTLAQFLDDDINQVVIEVSSHALDQHRTDGIDFDIAIFTNLTRDHLDYHLDMESYGVAKQRLFESKHLKWAIINQDDPFSATLIKNLADTVIPVSYSLKQRPAESYFIYADKTAYQNNQLKINFKSTWGDGVIHSNLLGHFNVANLLATLAVLLINKIPLDQAISRLEQIKNANGRMQTLNMPNKPLIVIDFAHTPDALQQVLKSLRPYCKGQLYCIFGCGGNRDTGKRPIMGKIATNLADWVYLTNDNPRFEDHQMIINDILTGIKNKDHVIIETNRANAIKQAINKASAHDIILIAGKGHENYQQIGDQKQPFSDRIHAQKALEI